MAAVSSDRLFDKVLIANRGEIACRIMKTCKRLGIKTVAVYSTADQQAKFVKMADEAVCIGAPPSGESYLRIDKIVDACLKTGAQAVHPGYGFLSEKPEFCAALKKNNIVFIGPDAESMDRVSDKIQSKILADEAGVHTIPGYRGEITSHEQLLREANKIGYPIMVKASGGGGGKGMHIAYNDEEAIEWYDLCRAEAMSAFNNGKMLVEKFVEKPRHIEVQVIADRHGNTLYLPERECSIQRRNQKVIEEAPSTFIDPATRKMMGEQAAAYARKVNYVSAGTVEMMVDKNRDFYFLEMNTRLQVEHPITELITGVDLVEQMLRAAANKRLSITQDDIKIHGWATEARICAEDPVKKFFPSIGRLSAYEEPVGEGLRIDSGILAGSQISVYYDSLIAKLCSWAPTRNQCLQQLEGAIDSYVIRGLNHNGCLIRDIITQERYLKGDITTNYIPEVYPDGFKKAALTPAQEQALNVVSASLKLIRESRYRAVCPHKHTKSQHNTITESLATVVDAQPDGKQNGLTLDYFYSKSAPSRCFEDNEHLFAYKTADGQEGNLRVEWTLDAEVIRAEITPKGATEAQKFVLQFHGCDEVSYKVQISGTIFKVAVLSSTEAQIYKHMPKIDHTASLKKISSPMPGVVVDVHVKPGDSVVAGGELLTLEAMKMRNKIRAEIDGIIKSVKVKVGDNIADSTLMVEFE